MANSNGGGMAALGRNNQDLEEEEEEVWAVMKTAEGHKSKSKSKTRKQSGSSSIPRSTVQLEGPSLGQSSAPVRIPDWSKIQHKNQPWNDACDVDADGGMNNVIIHEDDDDDVVDMVPPHEYLARKMASTQIASFSMCEGVGRTLKGRDLSNLRNAILTKTGFIE